MSIDEAVVFTSFHQSPLPLALLLRLAGVGRIAAISDDYPGSLLDVRHRVVDDVHEVVRNLSLAAAAGHDRRDDGRLRVVGDPAARPGGLPDDYVVVHPGASVASRRWRPDGFAEVVALLVARGRDVVVTGSAAEAGLAAAVCTTTPALDLAGRTSAAGLAEVLRGASVVVVGNTGPAHLAAAVGTPVVSLFAATVPVTRWRPWGVAHEVLGHQDIGCSGCRARSCPLPEQSCLSSVTAADVVAAVDRLSAGVLVA
jgi:ADP-heptose:LPS heptosyltransferase